MMLLNPWKYLFSYLEVLSSCSCKCLELSDLQVSWSTIAGGWVLQFPFECVILPIFLLQRVSTSLFRFFVSFLQSTTPGLSFIQVTFGDGFNSDSKAVAGANFDWLVLLVVSLLVEKAGRVVVFDSSLPFEFLVDKVGWTVCLLRCWRRLFSFAVYLLTLPENLVVRVEVEDHQVLKMD